MATATRIYKVSSPIDGVPTRLVRAPNPAQAVRHVVADTFNAAPATQDELVNLVSAGVVVESVGVEAQAELPL